MFGLIRPERQVPLDPSARVRGGHVGTMARGCLRAVAVSALLAAGCGQVAAPTGNAASAPRVTPTAKSTSTATLCTPSNRCLALVRLRGSDQIVVRDITDIAHPNTVGNLGHVLAPLFLDGSTVTYADGTDMWRVPVGGSPSRMPPPFPGIEVFAWSPDGNALVFVHGDPSASSGMDVSLWKGGSIRPLGSIPFLGAGGCEAFSSCNIPNLLDYRLLYSPDGTQISLVINSFGASVFRVWSADGKSLMSSDSHGVTMSAWSGSDLYFRDTNGVSVWRHGTISTFLPGVAWIKPSASAAGGVLVYSVRDSDGWAHVQLVETETGKTHELSKARTDAVFLTSRFIWYEGERACAPADQCGPNPPIHPLSGKSYIYDLQDGTESESIITKVFDVWPHPA